METISQHILFLAAYNLIFFRDFYKNPFKMCTSELASTYFPFWRWARGRVVFKSPIYYEYPASIPFLSSFYPVHVISSFLGQFLELNTSFVLFSYQILLHFLLTSVLGYFAFLKYGAVTALFGAICFSYSAYFVKPFTPAAVYTHTWLVGSLIGGKFGAFSFCLAILGGYWPTLVYTAPLAIFLHPEIMIGSFPALIQIIPFLWYWPKSIRSGQKHDPNIGKVPLWRYLDLIWPNRTQNTINGVFWPEMALYLGLIPCVILMRLKILLSIWIVPIILSFFLRIQRIQARSIHLFSSSLILLVVSQIHLSIRAQLSLLLLQAFLLLENAGIYPHFPFCQWWKKPSDHNYDDITDWPGFTGYLINTPGSRYLGGFSLKETHDR